MPERRAQLVAARSATFSATAKTLQRTGRLQGPRRARLRYRVVAMHHAQPDGAAEAHAPRARRRLLRPAVIAFVTGVSATLALAAARAAGPGVPAPLFAGMAGAAAACYWMARSAAECSVMVAAHAAPPEVAGRGRLAVLLDVAAWSAMSALVSVLASWSARAPRRQPAPDEGAATAAWRARMSLVTPVIVLEGVRWRTALSRSEELMDELWSAGQAPRTGTAALLAGGVLATFPIGGLLLWTAGAAAAVVVCTLWLLTVDVVTMTLSARARVELYALTRDARSPRARARLD